MSLKSASTIKHIIRKQNKVAENIAKDIDLMLARLEKEMKRKYKIK